MSIHGKFEILLSPLILLWSGIGKNRSGEKFQKMWLWLKTFENYSVLVFGRFQSARHHTCYKWSFVWALWYAQIFCHINSWWGLCRFKRYIVCVGTRINIWRHSGHSSLYRVLKDSSPVYLCFRHNARTDIAPASSLSHSISPIFFLGHFWHGATMVATGIAS